MADVVDKSLRSVFVGNIPYEVSEEKLKEIFSEVGPVLSFKLVFDRDSGKPKGYGFCEYKDQETALSAMRNLNNYEIGGRTLRVDNACTEKSRMEMQSLMQTATTESQYGESVPPERAPETISKAVASLPPEQMYELMKQMKQCIQNNPSEARQMLLQNPQLAYALLQAQIVMRIVDPQTALTMLHQTSAAAAIATSAANDVSSVPPPAPPVSSIYTQPRSDYTAPPAGDTKLPWNNVSRTVPQSIPTTPAHQAPPAPAMDMDMRNADPRLNASRFADQDLRVAPSQMIGPPFDHFGREADPRTFPGAPRPGMIGAAMTMPIGVPSAMSAVLPMTVAGAMPRVPPMSGSAQPLPPRPSVPPAVPPVSAPAPPISSSAVTASTTTNQKPPASTTSGADSEKAALIMQVLQLTDEQIAMLPAEQRQSILVLKEQIARSAKR